MRLIFSKRGKRKNNWRICFCRDNTLYFWSVPKKNRRICEKFPIKSNWAQYFVLFCFVWDFMILLLSYLKLRYINIINSSWSNSRPNFYLCLIVYHKFIQTPRPTLQLHFFHYFIFLSSPQTRTHTHMHMLSNGFSFIFQAFFK